MAFRNAEKINSLSSDAKAAVELLEQLKGRAMHVRLFSAENPPLAASKQLLNTIEGDIEEWMITNGYWVSEYEYDGAEDDKDGDPCHGPDDRWCPSCGLGGPIS
jgi:hypothetical protein